jgi:hypothetical protein
VVPGGESFLAVIERVSRAVHQLVETYAGRDVIAVAHGGTIRAALALALSLEPEAALAFTVENCSLTRIDHIDRPATATAGASSRSIAHRGDRAGSLEGKRRHSLAARRLQMYMGLVRSRTNVEPQAPAEAQAHENPVEDRFGYGRRVLGRTWVGGIWRVSNP